MDKSGEDPNNVANLSAQLEELSQRLENLQNDFTQNTESFFMCSMALVIFFMQPGFAFLEAGAVRSKNTTNILIKNLLDSCIAVIGYWAIGWALAYGSPGESVLGLFFGQSQFFLADMDEYAKFFFQYVFAATASTIVSGAVAERCEFATYITYCSAISAFVYPIATHWGWSDDGWMKKGIQGDSISTTYIDFAGSGMVHLCAGTISIIAAYMMGPRLGRFSKLGEEPSGEIKGHSVPFAALGGFILMFGFLAFNGGSVPNMTQPGEGKIVALAMINTIMCGAFAAMIYLVIHYVANGKWTLLLTINACLTGMVSACAGCNNMMPWASAFTGTGAGLIYLALSKLMIRLKIDDPLDAFAVHAGGGLWGLFAICIVGKEGVAYALVNLITGSKGVTATQAFSQLGWNMLCAVAIIIWSSITMIPVFLLLKKMKKLRVPEEIEIKGLDIYKHGEAAYPLHAYGHGWDEFEKVTDRRRKLSQNVEMSLEELAAVYDRQTNDRTAPPGYHNPSFYEHPEHHHRAKVKSTSGAARNEPAGRANASNGNSSNPPGNMTTSIWTS
uniref:Ammonium transporter n=1 Tax=Steinernema glaseri TaxID=37863 RepID=A0A1I7YPB2_9BILA